MSGQWTKKIVIDCYVHTKWAHSPTSPCALFLAFSTRGTYMYHQSLDLHSFFFYWQSATCHDWAPLCVPWRPPCVGTMCGTRPSSTPIYPILFFVDLSPNCVGRRSNLHSRCQKHAYTWLLDWLIRSTAASTPQLPVANYVSKLGSWIHKQFNILLLCLNSFFVKCFFILFLEIQNCKSIWISGFTRPLITN